MKESPETKKLEQMLQSSKLVAGGFMGNDKRGVYEIIEADDRQLEKLGITKDQLAKKMKQITELTKPQLGNWIEIDENLQAKSDDFKGLLVCPWPHAGRIQKRITTVKNTVNGQTIKWSDLNIHLIEEHGFFEGKGSEFRIEPEILVSVIF
jgi:hypothetical protein